jgi:hypothetical protein
MQFLCTNAHDIRKIIHCVQQRNIDEVGHSGEKEMRVADNAAVAR